MTLPHWLRINLAYGAWKRWHERRVALRALGVVEHVIERDI